MKIDGYMFWFIGLPLGILLWVGTFALCALVLAAVLGKFKF
jgi:hypothetical protein